jgi:hypothetical protein
MTLRRLRAGTVAHRSDRRTLSIRVRHREYDNAASAERRDAALSMRRARSQ